MQQKDKISAFDYVGRIVEIYGPDDIMPTRAKLLYITTSYVVVEKQGAVYLIPLRNVEYIILERKQQQPTR